MKSNIINSLIVMLTFTLFVSCGTNSSENPVSVGPFAFFNATTPLVISTPMMDSNGTVIGGDYNLSVQLLEYDLVKANEIIQMKSFPLEYGVVAEQVALTDTNGRATFKYYPPVGGNYDAIRGQDITLQAVYLDSTSTSTTPSVLLTQDFVLQFR